MAKQNINSKKGFTIIEVVLVLAIAGLIFLMVFVALPALQRSQRDTQRRQDMSRVDTSLVQYETNHTSGAAIANLPGKGSWAGNSNFSVPSGKCADNTACSFIREYMNSGSGDKTVNDFTDPDGSYYSLVITDNWADKGSNMLASYPSPTGIPGNKASKLTITNGKATIENSSVDGTSGTAFDAHVIYIIPGGMCDGADAVVSTPKHFAIMYRLEGAGVYCMDDQ